MQWCCNTRLIGQVTFPSTGLKKSLILGSFLLLSPGDDWTTDSRSLGLGLTLFLSSATCFPTENPGQNLNRVFQDVPKRRTGSEGSTRPGLSHAFPLVLRVSGVSDPLCLYVFVVLVCFFSISGLESVAKQVSETDRAGRSVTGIKKEISFRLSEDSGLQ